MCEVAELCDWSVICKMVVRVVVDAAEPNLSAQRTRSFKHI